MSTLYSLRVIRVEDVDWPSKVFRSKAPRVYIRVTLGDTVRRTRIIRNNPSPEWNELLFFSSSGGSEDLNIQVKHDLSVFSKSCVAYVDISLSDLLQKCADGEAQIELQTPPHKGRTTATRAGVLRVRLKRDDERTNAAKALEGAERAVAQSDFPHSSGIADTSTTVVEQLSGGSDLYKTLGALCTKLDVFVNAIDVISTVHPCASVAWQLVSVLYKAVSSQFGADKKVVELVQAMNEAFKFTDEAHAIIKKAQSLRDAIVVLLKQTAECCIFIQEYARQGFTERILDLSANAKIEEFMLAIATAGRRVESGVNLSVALVSAHISANVDTIFLRNHLDPRQSSAFDRPQCLAGTRMDIRERILAWTFSGSDQNIFWLHGVAGSGKSTISTTIAEYVGGISRRGAFLYFVRGKSEPGSVIRTIAHELAMFDSSIGDEIIAAISQDKNVAMSSAANQFERLLLQPLTAASPAMRGPVIVVLDALDECGTPESRRGLMKIIRDDFGKLPKNFRFLITSRPEDDIRKALTSQTHSILRVSLDCASETSRKDVASYLRVEMDRIVREESGVPVPNDWPWDENLRRLGEAAGGLFIWAATAVKFVSSRRDDPFQKLKELVENSRSLSLVELYATVLSNVIYWEDPSSKSRFIEIISLILFSKEPLTVATIDGLLNYPPESSSGFLLSGMRSVIDYSSDGPVRLFHASFSDYLLSPERSSDPWFVNMPVQKTYVAIRCFEVMKKLLRFNICGLESSYIRNDTVSDLQTRVDTRVRSHLTYACLFWAQHLCEAPFSSQLMEQLTEFLYQRLLYWLEVLSLSKKLARVHSIISNAMAWIPAYRTDILAFIRDADNLVILFFGGISQATPHLYISLLPLSPRTSKVAKHYLKHASSLVNVTRVGRERPPPLLKELVGHERAVTSVAFSPDGTRLASGSQDATVRVWDTNSGDSVVFGPLERRKNSVCSIVFSPDGTRIASGSDDRMVRVWDARSGEIVTGPFEGHKGAIASVAFSPNGTRLASGSRDATIRVWNANSGEVVAGPFEGHADAITSVAFSSDGTRLASGSLDATIRVWDASTGEVFAGPFEGHTSAVMSVTFSPDGTRLASGSRDAAVRVWDATSGETVAGAFEGHSSAVSSVTFSPNGIRIASGSWDGTVRVWNASSGEVVAGPFEEHVDWVRSVAFSPEGRRIASGSNDGTVRVWNASSGEVVSGPFEGHTESVSSVAFSSDGSRIASGSYDNTVRVWDASSGEVVAGPFEGHIDAVTSVVFSPDASRIASASEDRTVRVWDANSGAVVAGPFEGHANKVKSVAFSPNGSLLASGSSDKTVRVWDVGSSHRASNDVDLKPSSPSSCHPSFSNWTVDEFGWLKSGDDILLWIPPFLRGVLFRPQNTLILSCPFYVKLDFSGSTLGNDWHKCFKLD